MAKQKIVVLVGPTAAGKTSLGLGLASILNAEIVSADSMQVYRGMDIGTAKATAAERAAVRHHLIDVVDPDESFDAARFQCLADRAIRDVAGRGKTVIVAGGTGLYIKALLRGLFRDDTARREETWEEKVNHYRALGEAPYKVLQELDPAAARDIHPNDRTRAQRALDVLRRTGTSITRLRETHRFAERRYRALMIGVTLGREALFDRINRRVDEMMEAGLMEEVEGLLGQGYAPSLPSMSGLGYRHMVRVVAGDWALPEAVDLLKRDTRRYAKRQMTWFRNQETVQWFEGEEISPRILQIIQAFLEEV